MGPKTKPLGLIRNRAALGAVLVIVPSIDEAVPPVMRAMMAVRLELPWKVTVWLEVMSNWLKLCRTVVPLALVRPRFCGMVIVAPFCVTTVPTEPSVVTWAVAAPAPSDQSRPAARREARRAKDRAGLMRSRSYCQLPTMRKGDQ